MNRTPNRALVRMVRMALAGALLATFQGDSLEAKSRKVKSSPKPSASKSVAPAAQVAVPGLVAHLDPKTGQLTDAPTDAQIEQFRQQLVRDARNLATDPTSGQALEPVYHRDGSVSVDLNGTMQSFSVVRKNPDGSIGMVCQTDPREAAKALAGAPSPAPSDLEWK